MMCQRCEELADEIRFLKRELGLEVERSKLARLQTSLGITPHQARILFALFAARGRVVTPVALEGMVPAIHGAEMRDTLDVFKVQICKLRRIIGRLAIETVWGKGYRIGDVGRLLVEEALESRARAA